MFPQLVIVNDELEIVYSPQERADLLHNLTALELNDVLIISHQQEYTNLAGEPQSPCSAKQLGDWVKAYLLKEGHCCLAKIDSLSITDAFQLLTID